MLIIALVLAAIGLAALVFAVVTSNALVAWVCIGASLLGVLLLIVDALRERPDGTARARARYDRAAKRLQQQNSRLAGFYERYGLDTFSVPEHRAGACPFG